MFCVGWMKGGLKSNYQVFHSVLVSLVLAEPGISSLLGHQWGITLSLHSRWHVSANHKVWDFWHLAQSQTFWFLFTNITQSFCVWSTSGPSREVLKPKTTGFPKEKYKDPLNPRFQHWTQPSPSSLCQCWSFKDLYQGFRLWGGKNKTKCLGGSVG